jgi:hypothetical protein
MIFYQVGLGMTTTVLYKRNFQSVHPVHVGRALRSPAVRSPAAALRSRYCVSFLTRDFTAVFNYQMTVKEQVCNIYSF